MADLKKTSWTTENIDKMMVAIDDGYKPKSTPFYDGNPNYKKGNIVFNYSDFELEEIYKCATDIIYFANNYATVMTDEGLLTITLRDYQETILKGYQENRFAIVLASRQVGKCTTFDSKIDIEKENETLKANIGNLYYSSLKEKRKLTTIEKIKWSLWKLYTKL